MRLIVRVNTLRTPICLEKIIFYFFYSKRCLRTVSYDDMVCIFLFNRAKYRSPSNLSMVCAWFFSHRIYGNIDITWCTCCSNFYALCTHVLLYTKSFLILLFCMFLFFRWWNKRYFFKISYTCIVIYQFM